MTAPTPQRQDHRLTFLRSFLQKPKEVGSIIPSSRFMEKRIVRIAEIERANVAIELGPGTGGTTRALLRRLKPNARLLAMEINPHFVKLLRTIRDPRLIVHEGSAEEIAAALARYGLAKPDVVLSGIPFSTIAPKVGLGILRSVNANLAPGGRFVAYQFRDRVESLGRRVFGAPRIQVELLNVPPMRVYRWDKQSEPTVPRA